MRRHRNRLTDSNKILYHPEWVRKWEEDPFSVYPLYIEVATAGSCNHRCSFCAVDYIGYVRRFPDADILVERLHEMGSLGVRSVMFAGEGEPTLTRDLARLCVEAKSAGIDVALTTNGTGMGQNFCDVAMESITWIKVSLDAATAPTHAFIHQTSEKDFSRIVENIKKAVEIRDNLGCDTDIGAQMIILPANIHEAVDFVKLLKDLGADYVQFKPYSQHRSSIVQEENVLGGFHYEPVFLEDLKQRLIQASCGQIDVEFRVNTMLDYESQDRGYTQCQATPTAWAYMMADWTLWSCSAYLKDPRFLLGNLRENTFQEVWMGETRRKHLEWVLGELDILECRKNCRMNSVNKTLWSSKTDPEKFEADFEAAQMSPKPDNIFI